MFLQSETALSSPEGIFGARAFNMAYNSLLNILFKGVQAMHGLRAFRGKRHREDEPIAHERKTTSIPETLL